MKRVFALVLALSLMFASIGALAEYGAVLKQSAAAYSSSTMRSAAGTLPKYTAVVVKSVRSGKAQLSVNGRTVWVCSRVLSTPWKTLLARRRKAGIGHTEDLIRIVKRDTYMYSYPSTKAPRIRVKKGTILTGSIEKKGWSMVLDRKAVYYGYIKTAYLEGVSGADGTHFALNPNRSSVEGW